MKAKKTGGKSTTKNRGQKLQLKKETVKDLSVGERDVNKVKGGAPPQSRNYAAC